MGLLLVSCAGLPFHGIYGQRTITNEEVEKKRPAPTASTAGTCLSVVNIRNASMPKIPRHLHLVNCFQERMLEFDGPMGQCFSRFLTVSQRSRGERGKRERNVRDRQEEYMQIVTYRTYKYS